MIETNLDSLSSGLWVHFAVHLYMTFDMRKPITSDNPDRQLIQVRVLAH